MKTCDNTSCEKKIAGTYFRIVTVRDYEVADEVEFCSVNCMKGYV